MLMILKIMTAVYLWLLFPLLLGSLWLETDQKINHHGIRIYLMGLISEWAVFFVLAKWAIDRKVSLQVLGARWGIAVVILSVLAAGKIMKYRQVGKTEWKSHTKERLLGAAALGIVTFLSIAGVAAEQEEYTIETAVTMYATDSLYEHDPTTGRGADTMLSIEKDRLAEDAKSPVEAYYAVNSLLCRLHPAKFIRILLPCFLMLFYGMVYQQWARYLFGESQKERVTFLALVCLLYATALVAERAIMFGVFQNSWNGGTLLFAGVVPMVVRMLLAEKHSRIWWGMQYAVCALAGQLLDRNGAFVVTFIFGVIWLAMGVKRWKDDRSI